MAIVAAGVQREGLDSEWAARWTLVPEKRTALRTGGTSIVYGLLGGRCPPKRGSPEEPIHHAKMLLGRSKLRGGEVAGSDILGGASYWLCSMESGDAGCKALLGALERFVERREIERAAGVAPKRDSQRRI